MTKTIAVVYNNGPDVQKHQRILEEIGYKTVWTGNLRGVMNMLSRGEKIDGIITNNRRGLTGSHNFVKKLREYDNGFEDLPVIISSSEFPTDSNSPGYMLPIEEMERLGIVYIDMTDLAYEAGIVRYKHTVKKVFGPPINRSR